MAPSPNYAGSTAAFEDGNGDGTTAAPTGPSMLHAWLIVVGSLGILWFLARGPFRNVVQ
jgi:hypothetical protein